jgi:hypothetical protein
MCATVTERIEAHRLEPDPLAEVIARLAAAPAASLRVAPARSRAVEISLVDAEADEARAAQEARAVERSVDVLEPVVAGHRNGADVAGDAAPPVPAPVAAPVSAPISDAPRYADRRSGAALTTVERLRRRAQRVGREMWGRGKPQTGR